MDLQSVINIPRPGASCGSSCEQLPDEAHALPGSGNPGSKGKGLQTDHNESVAATIEPSLAPPMSRGLGPDAHNLLGVIAFFPQGINEDNLDWLFPAIVNRRDIFDQLCDLSLTYRSNGFTTMLAPLRDDLRPKDPASSPLLRTTKDHYFRRLSVYVSPGEPGFEEARWITSEDVNVEHLLDVFTSIDVDSDDVWVGCGNFIAHLYWHKPRLVGLGPKIERLSDGHSSKPQCLLELSRLFDSIGNHTEQKRLLTHALKIWRKRGRTDKVAETLRLLATANGRLGLYKEGIQRVKEASELSAQLGHVGEQALALEQLASLLQGVGQLDAAEIAASQLIAIIPDGSRPRHLYQYHNLLGRIYHSKGETEKAINHFKMALDIASPLNWDSEKSRSHYSLAQIYTDQGRFDDAHAHIEQAKLHSINYPHCLGCAMNLQAGSWYREGRYEEARAECLRAIELFGSLKAMKDVETCRILLYHIEKRIGPLVVIIPGGSNPDGELPKPSCS